MFPILKIALREPWILIPALVIISVVAIKQKYDKPKEEDMVVKTRNIKVTNGAVVRGIKVTEKNFADIAEWVKSRNVKEDGATALWKNTDGELKEQRVQIRTAKGIRVARVGDFVIRGTENNVFGVLKADEFVSYV